MAVAAVFAGVALVLAWLAPWLWPALDRASVLALQALALLAVACCAPALLRAATARARADDQRRWRECERQLLQLGQALPGGLLVVHGSAIASANAPARAQLGLGADLAAVAPDSVFVDPAAAQAALSGALPHAAVLQLRRAGGAAFHARLTVHGIDLAQRSFRLLMFDDLSPGDRLDARLRRQREELQALAGRLLTVQEDERRTLSRELHDDVGQAITAIKLGAVALLDQGDATHAEIVQEIIATADQTVVKLRNLSMLLRPPQLDALGLEPALRWQSQALFRSQQTALELNLAPLAERADAAVELACFRIAQEALTNVLRHSSARKVTVALAVQDRTLVLSVHDDGCGFDPARTSGLGLVTMRERAQQLGGSFRIDTDPGVGTCLHARLPLSPASPS